MSVLNKEDFISSIQARLGEDNSDEALSFLENLTDTYNALDERANSSVKEWEEKYNKLDTDWRNKYKERFNTPVQSSSASTTTSMTNQEELNIPTKFEDLFIERK